MKLYFNLILLVFVTNSVLAQGLGRGENPYEPIGITGHSFINVDKSKGLVSSSWDGRLYFKRIGIHTKPKRAHTTGWGVKVFRPEALKTTNNKNSLKNEFDNSFSNDFAFAIAEGDLVKKSNPKAPIDRSEFSHVNIFEGTNLVHITAIPNNTTLENPYRGSRGGRKTDSGKYLIYDTILVGSAFKDIDVNSTLRLVSYYIKVIVKNPYTERAEIENVISDGKLHVIQDENGKEIIGIEPTLTADGRLLIFHNRKPGKDFGTLSYMVQPDKHFKPTGWSVSKNLVDLNKEEDLWRRYPIARYPIRDSKGNLFTRDLKGAYPWIDLDGNDLFFAYTPHSERPRRAGSSVLGSSTRGLVRLIDGGPNTSRRGLCESFEDKVCKLSKDIYKRNHRLFTSSIGRSPGIWSPYEFMEKKILPLTDKKSTYPMFSSNTHQYFEVSFEETTSNDYDFFLEMSEGLNQNGDYDINQIPDVSGSFFEVSKSPKAMFAEEAFSDCTPEYCPYNNTFSPPANFPLFSGKALYFNKGGHLLLPQVSKTGKRLAQNTQQFTLNMAVMPLQNIKNLNGTRLFMKGGFASIRILNRSNRNTIQFHIFGKNKKGVPGWHVVRNIDTNLPLNKWSHLSLTCNTDKRVGSFFLNGKKISKFPLPPQFKLINHNSKTIIGPNNLKTGEGLVVALDQVGLARSVLTDYEIAKQANLRLKRDVEFNSLPLGIHSKDIQNNIFGLRGYHNPKLVEIGKSIFFDRRMSKGQTMSCAHCHKADQGFSDGLEKSDSRLKNFASRNQLKRNTPSLFNLALKETFFHDGRSQTLREQPLEVFSNIEEMHLNINHLANRLKTMQYYKNLFTDAFKTSDVNSAIKPHTIVIALESFQASLLSGNSKLDQYVHGDIYALTQSERRGKNLFYGKARCASCHSGSAMTDNSYHKLPFLDSEDLGRFDHTKNNDHKGKIATPTLREAAFTAPFFHNGSARSISEVIDLYTAPIDEDQRPIDDNFVEINLSEQEKIDLTNFVRNALSAQESLKIIPPKAVAKFTKPAMGNRQFLKGQLNLVSGKYATFGKGRLHFNKNGNLVILNDLNETIWVLNAPGRKCDTNNCRAVFQGDGNFVLYQNGKAWWHTKTYKKSAHRLLIDASGKNPVITIRDNKNKIIWNGED